MRKLILGTASVLALGIGGAYLDYSTEADNATANTAITPELETSHTLPAATDLSKDDVRWAQLELRNMGLYSGSLDGILGQRARRAVAQFQKNHSLKATRTLDDDTMDALIDAAAIGEGSSRPRNAAGARSLANSPGGSGLGGQTAPK